MSDPRPRAVELHCGCRPMFHQPVPAVGSWLFCTYHERGVLVVPHPAPSLSPAHPQEDPPDDPRVASVKVAP